MRRTVARLAALLACGSGTVACSLAEVVTPDSADILVVEAVLRADAVVQRVLIHPSLTSAASDRDAVSEIVVRAAGGREIRFNRAGPEACLEESVVPLPDCFVSGAEEGQWVQPGREFELTITTRGGGRAFGRTRVPGEFQVLEPRIAGPSAQCWLPPGTPLPLVWSRSVGTWTYLANLEIRGLRAVLGDRVPGEIPDPINLTAISISESDTTMILPRDFGVFQRTEFDQPLLLALRDGLPAGVSAQVVIAAADRNFVNSVRGGSFNPSGRIRIPSVAGAATGVFGSVAVQTLLIEVAPSSASLPPCLGNAPPGR